MAELEAGPELDAEVGRRVFGLDVVTRPSHVAPSPHVFYRIPEAQDGRLTERLHDIPVPHYSTEIAAAWQVFEAALMRFGNASIDADMEDWGRGAFLGNGAAHVVTVVVGDWTYTAPVAEAICRATLLALAAADQGAADAPKEG